MGNTKRKKPFTIRISEETEKEWDQHAKDHYDGNRSGMVRKILHNEIRKAKTSTGSSTVNEDQIKTIINEILDIKFKQLDLSNIKELSADLSYLKIAMDQLLRQKVAPIVATTEPIKEIDDEVTTKATMHRYLEEEEERIVGLEEVSNYLIETCPRCARYIEGLDRKSPTLRTFTISRMMYKVYSELFDETGNTIYKKGMKKYDN